MVRFVEFLKYAKENFISGIVFSVMLLFIIAVLVAISAMIVSVIGWWVFGLLAVIIVVAILYLAYCFLRG